MTHEEREFYERASFTQMQLLIQSIDTAATAVQSAMETLHVVAHNCHIALHGLFGEGQHDPIIMVQRHDEDEEEME